MILLDLSLREQTDESGLVGVSSDLSPANLMAAYRAGVFPWPGDSARRIPWFCPPERGILDFCDLHVPRSLQSARRRCELRFTIDAAFEDVIAGCSQAHRPGQPGTWILPQIRKAYSELHRLGHAHSVEAWDGETLVGGLYGVDCGGAFTGESMFHRAANASKLCVLHLVEHLHSRGLEWIDAQVVTPHMELLGVKLIPRREFLERLEVAQSRGLKLFS